MGKGDKRTRRGKLWRGTYGKRRPRKKKKNLLAQPTPGAEAPGGTAVPSGSAVAS